MRLNHLDLHVPDVAATAAFFTRYLGLRLVETRGSGNLAILSDGALELVLSQGLAKFGSRDQNDTPVSYHVGFILDSRDDVDRVYGAMQAGGLDVRAPRELRGGWLFYCTAPGNVLVEVGARELLV
jgi:catechol 2,3-dioxygenase-like lactoylglutathione lyase family enzyme